MASFSTKIITAFPILKGFKEYSKSNQENTWDLRINSDYLRLSRLTPENVIAFLSHLRLTVRETDRDTITVQLPSDLPLEEYLQSEIERIGGDYQPRFLTEEELDEITSDLPIVSSPIKDVGSKAREEIIKRIKQQLRDVKITPLGIPDLKSSIIRMFIGARVEPGQAVGLTVAESLSALTQAALNAFHETGARSHLGSGMEMLQDLLSTRKERRIEMTHVHFLNKQMSYEEVYDKRPEIIGISVGDIVKDYVIDVPERFDQPWWVRMQSKLTGVEIPEVSVILQLQLRVDRMYAHQITMDDVVKAIERNNEPNTVYYIAGPIDSGIIYLYPNEQNVSYPLIQKKIPTIGDIARTFFVEILLPTLDKSYIKGIPLIKDFTPEGISVWEMISEEIPAYTQSQIDELPEDQREEARRTWILVIAHLRMRRDGLTYDKLFDFLEVLGFVVKETDPETGNVIVVSPNDLNPRKYAIDRRKEAKDKLDIERKQRIDAIRQRRLARRKGEKAPEIVYSDSIDHQIYRTGFYYKGVTIGTNMPETLLRRDVDTYQTYSNNLEITLRTLGIEATRNLAIQEFNTILEAADLSLDPRHIILLADFMTNRGVLLPISFTGVARQNPGPLTLGSVERPLEVFRQSAAYNQSEKISTVSSSIYVGQRSKIGTGYIDLKIDEEKLAALEKEKLTLEVDDVESAIDSIDKITFGADDEPQLDPLEALANLSIQPTAPETVIGSGSIQPSVEEIKTKPLISKLAQEAIDKVDISPEEEQRPPVKPVRVKPRIAIQTRRISRPS